MRSRIRKILRRLDRIDADIPVKVFESGHEEETPPVPLTRRPETDSFVSQKDIIKREEDQVNIVNWLLDDVNVLVSQFFPSLELEDRGKLHLLNSLSIMMLRFERLSNIH
ncbi:hypothetical protein TIFTF001_018871 [Ficus carica]|uniref:Uncharacterized protein n=1 Tax=Ficus carica TaxID=3494 RepID=A0AA88AEW2_FICCA|nr:hypothetical protein TIFTF001_018871 [Ficus carica]